ncbi:unnamed protein product [Spodoptera littoralis]|uniref:B-block binding subunit of TFIIIC domain-containing protein n=1 Tax=Spodoptera littoralis TaxID=7109 RepID=A0A9P0I3D3_SPOLI|nr:unnamed protein product [Spodoptera littoralis]CAH1640348.1 unnamed protein product [Spodoptera littoralis]
MEKSVVKCFAVNYKPIIIDEIALEGLEGIGVDLLWRRVQKRISSDLTEKMKVRYWNFIVNSGKVSFYQLPEPLPYLELLDRFEIINEATGHLREPDVPIDGPYEYKPIEGEYGSCRYYETRTLIPIENLKTKTYEAVMLEYGDTLIIVANKEERWHALAPHQPISNIAQLSSIHYCMLELIGRSRDNGQSTIGRTNLNKIIKDPKTLFYNRKYLGNQDLIKTNIVTESIAGKGFKALLVRLKRFSQPSILTMPKVGILHNVVQYLLQQPDFSEKTEVIVKKGLISQKQNKRLQKTVNIFKFEERTIEPDETNKLKTSIKRKFIYLSSRNDESSESEEESQGPPMKCQYKIGVSLLRQAYERFLDAGLEGLTQVQLGQQLGVEFYTSRGICRMFKAKNIVREYLEDKGKQRTARFIARAATGEMDVRYSEEKQKFLEYLKESQVPKEDVEPSEDEVPAKKIKLEDKPSTSSTDVTGQNSDEDIMADVDMTPEKVITEVKVLDGFENTKTLGSFTKNPTLRQLTFANGVFKVLKKKQCVSGYITLSNLTSKEINEPPMDTKALKSFVQKLVTDAHIKIYKIKWPGIQKYSVLICAAHVKATDPIIKAKYKEICMRAVTNKKVSLKKEIAENTSPSITQFANPRYMKIQKLHEFLTKLAYFEHVKPESHSLPAGFVSIVDFIQEVTIGFAIQNMASAIETNPLVNQSQLDIKMKDAPPHIYKALMRSCTLQNAIRLNLKVLAMLGLIQLVRPVTDEKIKEKSYYFETFEDVSKYWLDVFQISVNTIIELEKRSRKQLQPPQRYEDEVLAHDNGTRYGDGNGPCGFDSCFYMEMPRLWQTYYVRPIQSHSSPKKGKIQIKIPKLKRKNKTKRETKIKTTSKIVAERLANEKLTRKRSDTTIKWSKSEDLIITICKAAITILSPSSQPGTLIVRNIVAKDILSIKDPKKTKSVCHSRASTLESNLTLIHEKHCIINELKRRRNLLQKYEGLLKKLRLRYSTNMTKFINKARLPMMELVWVILQVMQSKSYIQKVPCVASNLADFYEHFTIITSTANKLCNMFKVPEHVTLKEAVVLTIMQTIDSEISTELGKKIYKTFEEYPEAAVRSAVEQLRKCGAIAAKEKIFNNQMRKLDLEDICQSSYKISAFYQRKWVSRLNSEFIDNLSTLLDVEQTESDVKGSAELNCLYCEMNAYDIIDIVSTSAPLITDAAGAPIMPEEINVLVIDSKYRLKTGTLRWKNKSSLAKISELFSHMDLNHSLKYLSSYTTVDAKEIKQNVDKRDPILERLDEVGEKGASFAELQKLSGMSEKELIEKLQQMENKKILKRVGFYENLIVLPKYLAPWTIKVGDKHIIITPWLTLTGKARPDIFFKWCGVIMNLIFERPGCSVSYLADKCEYLTYRSAQDVCMFLEKYECIKLAMVNLQPVDLFSDEAYDPEMEDFNPYGAPEKMIAHPVKNCLTKYCYIKKKVLDLESNDALMDKLFKC